MKKIVIAVKSRRKDILMCKVTTVLAHKQGVRGKQGVIIVYKEGLM
jgi:hypothetical protein